MSSMAIALMRKNTLGVTVVVIASVALAWGVAGCGGSVAVTPPGQDEGPPAGQPTPPADGDVPGEDVTPPGDESGGTADGTPISFSRDVRPIFARRCTICHVDGGFADIQGIELRLAEDDTYDQLVHQRSVQRRDLVLVVPGDSASSLLYLKVSSDDPPIGNRMPLGGALLPDSEINLIRDWIDQGALDN